MARALASRPDIVYYNRIKYDVQVKNILVCPLMSVENQVHPLTTLVIINI